MAPLPANNTNRYKVIYQQGPYTHSQIWRAAPGVGAEAAAAVIQAAWDEMSPALYTTTITDFQFSAAGSDFFTPAGTSLVGFTSSTATVPTDEAPRFVDFVGRSSGGRRVRLTFFGYQGSVSGYRVTPGEDAHVADMIALLNGETDLPRAIDDLPALWKPYADSGYNAHWQRAVRG